MISTFKIYFFVIIAFSLTLLSPSPSHAVNTPTPTPRIAECDACGFCLNKEKPESWNACKACLYPQITPTTWGYETQLIITSPIQDPNNPNKVLINVPIPPAKGKYYTQLGCVDTALSSFSDPGAVGGVLNFLLSKLIFPVTGMLAFLFLLYGAFLLITAQGSEEQIGRGKRYITGSLVGIIFTFSSVLIINIVGGDILRIPGLGKRSVEGDLTKIKDAIVQLENGTGKSPGGIDRSICIQNPETNLNSCSAGLVCDTWPYGGSYPGKQLTIEQVTDPWGKPYQFDPDYRCRPDVAGCKGLAYPSVDPNDAITGGRSRIVRVIHSLGPDGIQEYCNPPGNSGCARKDEDNIVLVLCE